MDRYIPPHYASNVNPRLKPGDTANLPIDEVVKSEPPKKIPPGFTYAEPAHTNLLPIILLILLVSPYIQKAKSGAIKTYDSEKSHVDGTNAVVDILTSIYPYLDPKYQDGANFIVGLAEIRANLQGLIDGTYRTPRITATSMPITNYKERAIGIIKSLQPYISLENQTQINRILYVNKTLEKLIDSIKKFKEHDRIRIQDSTAPSISRAMEILDILKILVPAEQLQYIDQISSVLKLLGTIELAQLSTSAIQGTGSITDGSEAKDETKQHHSLHDSGESQDIGETGASKSANISKALSTILNQDQAKSLELIMKMAQLLSKDTADKNGAD